MSIEALGAPEETVFGEDTSFAAEVKPTVSGQVHFALKTYAGETVWEERSEIVNGKASVVLTAEQADGLEKGSRVLVATVNGDSDESAHTAVRLRGRIFRDVTEAPTGMKDGDELVITDMTLLELQSSVSKASEKGKWWLRNYTLPGTAEEHSLVCVQEHDFDDPQSCIAPAITLPLNLEGWYEIWVRTRRDRGSGGIDVRLSGEGYFRFCDPREISPEHVDGQGEYGALLSMLYRSEDMTGQNLVFQQPFGPYEANSKACNASLAGVRLVKLSEKQVEQIRAERARKDTQIMGYHEDDDFLMAWGRKSIDPIARLREPLRYQSSDWISLEIGEESGLIMPTPYSEITRLPTFSTDFHRRLHDILDWAVENDINMLEELARYAHEVDLKVFASYFVSRCFNPFCAILQEHPDWRITRPERPGYVAWDYARPEVHKYVADKIGWVIENHDIDGFMLDYTRYGHNFNVDEPNKAERMNAFIRKLRASVDAINTRKKRKCLLVVSFGERCWHLLGWGTGELENQGLDPKTWIEEGLFDILMPEGPTVLDYIEMAKGTQTQVWPRKEGSSTLENHQKIGEVSPKRLERDIKWALDHGADGIYFFNHSYSWIGMSRLGFREELELRTKVDEVYGIIEGPVATFITWYPSADEKEAQYDTFKPPTIPPDGEQIVDGEVNVPIRNTFAHPVTASVSLVIPEVSEGRWAVTSAEGSVALAAGEEGEVILYLKGKADGYETAPALKIELSDENQIVLRRTVPLRVGPTMRCRKAKSSLVIDGEFSESRWRDIGGLESCAFLRTDDQTGAPWQTKTAMAYDATHLYLAYECTGLAVFFNVDGKEESRDVCGGDHIKILIDPEGEEMQYFTYGAIANGERSNTRARYAPFNGRFRRDEGWKAEWMAETTWLEDGYRIEMAIPFSSLELAEPQPKAGQQWRVNIVAESWATDDGKPVLASWAGPQEPFHLPRYFGTLHGTLVFED